MLSEARKSPNIERPIQLFDDKETASILGVSTVTLAKWRWEKKGPRYRKIGALVRYELSDLRAYVDAA